MIRTLRTRLTLWHLFILSGTLTLFAGLLYAWLSNSLVRHHDRELARDADRFASRLAGSETRVDPSTALNSENAAGELLMIRNASGNLSYRSPRLAAIEPTIGRHTALVHAAALGLDGEQFFTADLERFGRVRFICVPLPGSPRVYLQLGRPLGDVDQTLRAIALASGVLVPIVLLLTGFGGSVIARRALRPLESINETIQAIQATDLTRRIEVHPRDDELERLVGTLNHLLARMEGAFASLREFAADASHQLQTPLTVMKGSLELARASQREPADERLLADLADEVRHLTAVVEDLRSLSLADARPALETAAPLDLSETLREAAEIIEALGELKGVCVSTRIEPRLRVWGDSVRMKQLLLNLGENAIKYTSEGDAVDLDLARNGADVVLRVRDTGPGISEEDLPHVFDRFYRGAGSDQFPTGTGLGLAIAKRIVEAHGGSITAASRPGAGAEFMIRLPLA